jgi:hypothetical protein
MKKILSPRLQPLPIVIDYSFASFDSKDVSRLRSALRHYDRVRGITFAGLKAEFARFFKVTKRPFPILERLELRYGDTSPLGLPAKFLGGSTPRLKRLQLSCVVFSSIAQILSSATALIELALETDTAFGPSPEESLPAYLQAMSCLCRLRLRILRWPTGGLKLEQPTNPEGAVPLTKLKNLQYNGPSVALNALLGRLAAPSLQGLCIGLDDEVASPVSHLSPVSRFIDDVDKTFHSAQLVLCEEIFRISLLTELEDSTLIGRRAPHFNLKFNSKSFPESIMRMSNVLSTKLATVKQLLITFKKGRGISWNDVAMWQRFLRLFCSVKVLRLERDAVLDIANCLEPTYGDSVLASRGFLPSLEVIELCAKENYSLESESVSRSAELSAFRPFASARKQAGRPIEVNMKTRFEAYLGCRMGGV